MGLLGPGETEACRPVGSGINPWVGKIPWNRNWQPTPVLLPGESQGQSSLAGYSPWRRKESDMAEHVCTAEAGGSPAVGRHSLAVGEGKGAAEPVSETGAGETPDGAGRQGRAVRIPLPALCTLHPWLLGYLRWFHCLRVFCVFSHPAVPDSLRPHGLYPARLLRPWDSPGKHTGVGGHFLLQGIFSTQGRNPCLLPWQVDSWPTELSGKPLSLSLVMDHLKFFWEAELK